MRFAGPSVAFSLLLLSACDPYRDTRSVTVVVPPEVVQRQSCRALLGDEDRVEEEVVLNGTAEHGRPDILRVVCGGQERRLIFALIPPPDDLGMKVLRKNWQKKSRAKCKDYRDCPKYNIAGRFVGTVRSDPGDHVRLLYFVRTADQLHRKRIPQRSKR